jgi:hypothetical protein
MGIACFPALRFGSLGDWQGLNLTKATKAMALGDQLNGLGALAVKMFPSNAFSIRGALF